MKLFFILLISTFASSAAFADCAPMSVQDSIKYSDYSIIGTVTNIEMRVDGPYNSTAFGTVTVEVIVKNTEKNALYVGQEIRVDMDDAGLGGVRVDGLGAYVLSGSFDGEKFHADSCLLSGKINQ